jgi:hypothetical protein
MGHFDPHRLLTEKEGRADELIENFYEVTIPGDEWESY